MKGGPYVLRPGMTVYVSGKMRGVPDYNRWSFGHWARRLNEAGFKAVNPMEIGDSIASPEEIDASPELVEKVLEADIAALRKCDAIFMLRGWETSEGARKELGVALEMGVPVVQEQDWKDWNDPCRIDKIGDETWLTTKRSTRLMTLG